MCVCVTELRSGVVTVRQVMKIRQMLTEVLLEVTNQEIEDVVSESIEEAKSKILFTNSQTKWHCAGGVHLYG